MESKEKVLNAMTEIGGPVRPGEVAEKTGIDKKELDKIFKTLVVENKIYSPKRCFYEVKK